MRYHPLLEPTVFGAQVSCKFKQTDTTGSLQWNKSGGLTC
jgi:hypothetical protein